MSNQVYGYITDKIMDELERGCVPWHQPWKSPDGVRMPTSFVSKKPYRGVNTFLLTVSRLKAGYGSNYWLTFKQIQALGGSVKGQHSEMVVFGNCLRKRRRIRHPSIKRTMYRCSAIIGSSTSIK